MDSCIILPRHNIANSEGTAKSLCWIPAFWVGDGNSKAWQEVPPPTISPLEAVLNDFRVLFVIRSCVLPNSAIALRLLLHCSLLKTQHMGKTHRELQRLGESCFHQEILLYQIPNIAFANLIRGGAGSSQGFETVFPTKAWEHFPAPLSQLVQLQGRRVLLPPWLSLMLCSGFSTRCRQIYVSYLGPGSITLPL